MQHSNEMNTGFDVRGVFLKNWDSVDETGYCSMDQDWENAQYVCAKLKIPIQRIDFVKQYWTDVFEYEIVCHLYVLQTNLCNYLFAGIHCESTKMEKPRIRIFIVTNISNSEHFIDMQKRIWMQTQ